MLNIGTLVTAPPRDEVLRIIAVDRCPDVDGERTAYICRRDDHERHFYGGHSVRYERYFPEQLTPACDIHPCGGAAEFGEMMCAGCKRGAA